MMEQRRLFYELGSHTVKTILGILAFWVVAIIALLSLSMTWTSLHPTGEGTFNVVSVGSAYKPGDPVLVVDNANSWETRLRMLKEQDGEYAVAMGGAGSTIKPCSGNSKYLCDVKSGGVTVETGVETPKGMKPVLVLDGKVGVLINKEIKIVDDNSIYGLIKGTIDSEDITIANILTGKISGLIEPATIYTGEQNA